MPIAHIALGSNLDSKYGNPSQTLSAAAVHLERLGKLVARSSIYETDPVGFRDQARFLNAAVALETHLEPLPLLHALLAIEREFGRDRLRSIAKGPRTLDLDLLLVEDTILSQPELTLPHPALTKRRFVLAPLAEIAPQLTHPVYRKTIAELLACLPDEDDNRIDGVRRL
jgi:2-amino-4-hydroxy-6-hydroxymethyldihydropteridine diphosphokinase